MILANRETSVSIKLFVSMVRAAAIAGIGILGCLGMASAAPIYRGSFDPPIYHGFGTIDLVPECVRTPDDGTVWISAGTGVGDCGPVDILDVVANSNTPVGGPPDGTITFAPPVLLDVFVTGLYWVNGVLTAIDTQVLFSVAQTGTFDNPFGYTLQYISGQAPDATGTPRVSVQCSFPTEFSAFSTIYQPQEDPGRCAGLASATAEQDPFELVAAVPEPGSLALLVGGLAAGWIVRRHRRRTT